MPTSCIPDSYASTSEDEIDVEFRNLKIQESKIPELNADNVKIINDILNFMLVVQYCTKTDLSSVLEGPYPNIPNVNAAWRTIWLAVNSINLSELEHPIVPDFPKGEIYGQDPKVHPEFIEKFKILTQNQQELSNHWFSNLGKTHTSVFKETLTQVYTRVKDALTDLFGVYRKPNRPNTELDLADKAADVEFAAKYNKATERDSAGDIVYKQPIYGLFVNNLKKAAEYATDFDWEIVSMGFCWSQKTYDRILQLAVRPMENLIPLKHTFANPIATVLATAPLLKRQVDRFRQFYSGDFKSFMLSKIGVHVYQSMLMDPEIQPKLASGEIVKGSEDYYKLLSTPLDGGKIHRLGAHITKGAMRVEPLLLLSRYDCPDNMWPQDFIRYLEKYGQMILSKLYTSSGYTFFDTTDGGAGNSAKEIVNGEANYDAILLYAADFPYPAFALWFRMFFGGGFVPKDDTKTRSDYVIITKTPPTEKEIQKGKVFIKNIHANAI
jgi:hypothetical protein